MEDYQEYREGQTRQRTTGNEIGAIGEIAEIKTKKLASGDKGVRITIDLNNYPGLVGALDHLWDTEKTIKLLIWQGE